MTNAVRYKSFLLICITTFIFISLGFLHAQINKNISLVDKLETPAPCYVTAIGNNVLYCGIEDTLKIMDFTNHKISAELGKIVLPDQITDLVVSDEYLFVADKKGGLRVINVSDPASPFETGKSDSLQFAYSLVVKGNYAYVVSWDKGLHIFNISAPGKLKEVGSFEKTGIAHGIAIKGNYAYIADYWSGLRVIDISDPENPMQVGFTDVPLYAQSVALSGNYAFVADGVYGLRVIDISDPGSPFEVGYYIPNLNTGYAFYIVLDGIYGYLANSNNGLRLIDLADPVNPTEVGFYYTPPAASNITVSGEYVIVSGPGLYVLKNDLLTNATNTEDIPQKVVKFDLAQNYPNPFNPTTVISYQLPVSSNVKLAVYDVLGREVAILVDKKQSAGSYDVTFNAQNLANGFYFYRLQAGEFTSTKKMLLIK